MEIGTELPTYQIKMVQNKKKISQEMLHIIHLSPGVERTTEYRKHSKIYARYDAKRDSKTKPLSLHEIAINEAAAQMCLWRPALLTRRDELFPLARRCVKEAGYYYVKAPSGSR